MVKEIIEGGLEDSIKTQYPHLRLPIAVYATVKKVTSYDGHYEYNLKILDKNKDETDMFPIVPNVKSNLACDVGDTVTALLMYGGLDVFIVGKVI